MDSVKEELHSDNEDCPVFSSFEEVSFVMKHELLSVPETLPPTEKTDVDSMLATNMEENLNSDISPLSALGDVKEEVCSVPLQCPDVKVEVMDGSWNFGTLKQEVDDEVTVEYHEMIPDSEMQLTYHQAEFVIGNSLSRKFCSRDISKEECDRRADVFDETPHNFIHIDERAYKCEQCTKEFLKIGWLVRHKATHSVANPYICDFCNREFARKVSLKVHIRTHTGEKPFKCSVCNKIFTTCSALRRHTQVHLHTEPEENAYKCEVCSKVFMTRSALYGHTRIHSIWSI